MRPETREQLDALSRAELSFYQRADAVARLFGTDDSGEIVAALDREFRIEFIIHAQRAYAPGGPRLVISGPPLPQSCLAAIRVWLRTLPTHASEILGRRVRMTYHRRDIHMATVRATPQGTQGCGDRDEVYEGTLTCYMAYFLPTRIWMYGIQLDSGEVVMGSLTPDSDLINVEITHMPSQWDGRRNGDYEIAPLD